MDQPILMDVGNARSYLGKNVTSSIFRKLLHISGFQVIHEIASISVLGHDVGRISLAKLFNDAEYVLTGLAEGHCSALCHVIIYSKPLVL